MFKPCENANELFRRLHSQVFEFKMERGHVEKLKFGDVVEVQAVTSDIPELVLKSILEFSSQFETGVIVHLSTGNNLFTALQQSRFDISNTPLAVVELLKISLRGERTLLVMEGLGVLFLSQKSLTGNLLPTSLIHSALKSLQDLGQAQYVVSLWICSAVPKLSGGLREGAYRDPVTILWKQKMPRVLQYAFSG